MRVDAINHVSQLYKPANAKKVDRAEGIKNKDAYEISQSAKDYQVAKKSSFRDTGCARGQGSTD